MKNDLVSKYQRLHQLNNDSLNELKSTSGIQIHDGSLLTGFDDFALALDEVIDSGETLVIHPDFDVDGICGGRVAKTSLEIVGLKDVKLYYPKSSDGYGLTRVAVDKILELWPTCKYILTVDNGINVKDACDYAHEKGIKLIVTDHHESILKFFPDKAIAVVNPNRIDRDETYPFKHISGTTVIWKLMLAYAFRSSTDSSIDLINDLKPLVGFSIISDVMPTVNENRRLLRESIDELNQYAIFMSKMFQDDVPTSYLETIYGLKTLLDFLDSSNKCKKGQMTDTTIGFNIAPMLNAPRRMNDDSAMSFKLFSLDNQNVVEQLNAINELRKEEVAIASSRFMSQYPSYEISELHGIVAQADYVRHGIVGLISGNLTEQFKIPSIVLSHDYAGSARAPYAYNLKAILTSIEDERPEFFIRWGGHAQAAGVAIHKEYYEDFQKLFDQKCKEYLQTVKVDDRVVKEKAIELDPQNLPSMNEIEHALQVFNSIKPYSFEVPEPKFKISFDLWDAERSYMTNGKHVKFTLNDTLGNSLTVIVWGQGEQAQSIPGYRQCKITVSGLLDVNAWSNRGTTIKTAQISSTVMSVEYLDKE